jgi:hypothetical protein
LQQSELTLQTCPYAAQGGPLSTGGDASGVPPPSVVPPSPVVPPSIGGGGGGVFDAHVPCVPPGGIVHEPPAQQSAVVVHPPEGITHDVPQTNGAPPG